MEIDWDSKDVKASKLTMEARVIGLLRGGGKGSSEEADGCARSAAKGLRRSTSAPGRRGGGLRESVAELP